MISGDYKVVSGCNDNHLILVNLKASKNVDGARVKNIFNMVLITLNKNSVPGDKSSLNSGGMRLRVHALTARAEVLKRLNLNELLILLAKLSILLLRPKEKPRI